MLAYQIFVNGKLAATAGVRQGVVSAIANWVSISPETNTDLETDWRAGFSLSALDTLASEELKFFRCDVQPGDEITLKLIETTCIDEPTERKPRDANAGRRNPLT